MAWAHQVAGQQGRFPGMFETHFERPTRLVAMLQIAREDDVPLTGLQR